MSSKSVLQECQVRVSEKKCQARVSYKSVESSKKCQVKYEVSSKSVSQECEVRVSEKKRQVRVSHKSGLQESYKSVK